MGVEVGRGIGAAGEETPDCGLEFGRLRCAFRHVSTVARRTCGRLAVAAADLWPGPWPRMMICRMHDFEVGILGPLVVHRVGGADRSRAAQGELFAVLALHAGRPLSSDALAEILWPERVPDAWEATLQAHVSLAAERARFGRTRGASSCIETHGSAYVLRVDAHEIDAVSLRGRSPAPGTGVACAERSTARGAASRGCTRGVAGFRARRLRRRALPRHAGAPPGGVATRRHGATHRGRDRARSRRRRHRRARHPRRRAPAARDIGALLRALYPPGGRPKRCASTHCSRHIDRGARDRARSGPPRARARGAATGPRSRYRRPTHQHVGERHGTMVPAWLAAPIDPFVGRALEIDRVFAIWDDIVGSERRALVSSKASPALARPGFARDREPPAGDGGGRRRRPVHGGLPPCLSAVRGGRRRGRHRRSDRPRAR